MQVVMQWTGGKADVLRQALRMTIEGFAQHLKIAPRTVSNWRKFPKTVPQSAVQSALDEALERAPDRAKVQFALVMGEGGDPSNGLRLPDASGVDPDEQDRVRGVFRAPSRLDGATVEHLSRGLYAQRHAEDGLGARVMIGPITAQLDMLVSLLRDTSGPHQPALMQLVANWTTFVGWLHTALREFPAADARFVDAEGMSDEINDGELASTATSYQGYIALLQGRYRAAIRATTAAIGTPGAHSVQVAYDTLQAAQSYAGLGDVREAGNLLLQASDLVTIAGEPPESLYWYTKPFLRMNIGLTQHSIGRDRDAVESLTSGIAGLPPEQQGAEWMGEYRLALDHASEGADEAPAHEQD
ncbi:hypothetical protein [Dactylosporangium sp. CA-092794]|uniref:hypothetical protein n=1 Tax=Dactylosporangium sp. CA-092794 TaxID=3239929 RepID=UPI003D92E777